MTRPDTLSKVEAQKLVAELARDTGNISFTNHGREQMLLRNLTSTHVIKTLRHGAIVEGPYLSVEGDWKMNFCYVTAGTKVIVVVAIDWPSNLVIVTAMD